MKLATSPSRILTGSLRWVCRYWLVLTVLLLSAITFLSLQTSGKLPTVPGSDKTHHFIAYAVLTLPTALRKPRYWWLLALFFIGYSGVIEVLQPLFNRYAEGLDWAANAIGVLMGTIIGFQLRRWLND